MKGKGLFKSEWGKKLKEKIDAKKGKSMDKKDYKSKDKGMKYKKGMKKKD